jgi:hypothetical protein
MKKGKRVSHSQTVECRWKDKSAPKTSLESDGGPGTLTSYRTSREAESKH